MFFYFCATVTPVMKMQLTFGQRVRLLREEQDLSQTDLGQALHMTQRKVSYLENDRYEPSLEDLKVLCTYFHVSADYLLGFAKPHPYPKQKQRTDTS